VKSILLVPVRGDYAVPCYYLVLLCLPASGAILRPGTTVTKLQIFLTIPAYETQR
jgi:hypothetical protein